MEAGEKSTQGQISDRRKGGMPARKACSEDARCRGYQVRSRTLIRHEEINDDREDNNAEHGVTTQGRNVSGHLLHPRRPDGIRKVISAAKKEKDPFIELGRVALQHLLGNVAECKN